MDHIMGRIYDYMSFDVEDLRKQYESKKYKKLSDCPSYGSVKAYCESYNALVKYYYGDEAHRYLLSPKRFTEE